MKTTMRIIAAVVVVAMAGVTVADSRNFMYAPSQGLGITITNRSLQRAAVGWTVDGVVNAVNAGYPATTNLPGYVDYVNGEEVAQYPPTQTNIIGYENVYGVGAVGGGEGSWAVGRGAGYGSLRFFSATTQTGAAYYAQSARQSLTVDGGPDIDTDAVVINTINPAYKMFFTYNPANVPSFPVLVTGVVYASTAGHSNQLSTLVIQVDWRHEGSMEWSPGTATLGANGEFVFMPAVAGYPTSVWVRARVKDANCLEGRTNLPATTSYLDTSGNDTVNGYGPILLVPEPGLATLVLLACAWALRAKRYLNA